MASIGDEIVTSFIDPRHKLLHHVEHLAALKRGEYLAPINAEIFVSNRCTHGCSWCAYAHTHTRGPLAGKTERPPGALGSGDLMDFDLAVQIFAQLKEAGVKSVTLSGGGEPTVHPRFDDIVTNIVDRGLEVGLYTHGSHINESRAASLKRLAQWVYVSLDECTPEAFKRNKGVDRFDAALTGVRNLVAAQGDAVIGLGFLLHPDNHRQVYSMVELGRSLGVNYVQFRPTVKYKQDSPAELDEDTGWVTEAIRYLDCYSDDEFVIADISRFKLYRNWKGFAYSTCFWSALQVAISPSGQMWRCTNKTEHPDALLGDLRVEDFATIWARIGGPCSVSATCRTLCRGQIANEQLDSIMRPVAHPNFV